MTNDDLLDEAARLALKHDAAYYATNTSRSLRSLDARVQQAEAELKRARSDPDFDQEFARMRGKLDKVRTAVTAELECLLHDEDDPAQCGSKRTVREVLGILDGKTGD